jgi:hypothetical protein
MVPAAFSLAAQLRSAFKEDSAPEIEIKLKTKMPKESGP